jgi:hypothetical protein
MSVKRNRAVYEKNTENFEIDILSTFIQNKHGECKMLGTNNLDFKRPKNYELSNRYLKLTRDSEINIDEYLNILIKKNSGLLAFNAQLFNQAIIWGRGTILPRFNITIKKVSLMALQTDDTGFDPCGTNYTLIDIPPEMIDRKIQMVDMFKLYYEFIVERINYIQQHDEDHVNNPEHLRLSLIFSVLKNGMGLPYDRTMVSFENGAPDPALFPAKIQFNLLVEIDFENISGGKTRKTKRKRKRGNKRKTRK